MIAVSTWSPYAQTNCTTRMKSMRPSFTSSYMPLMYISLLFRSVVRDHKEHRAHTRAHREQRAGEEEEMQSVCSYQWWLYLSGRQEPAHNEKLFPSRMHWIASEQFWRMLQSQTRRTWTEAVHTRACNRIHKSTTRLFAVNYSLCSLTHNHQRHYPSLKSTVLSNQGLLLCQSIIFLLSLSLSLPSDWVG